MSMGKSERLDTLLGLLGLGAIDVNLFWRQMEQAGLSADDVDRYCEAHAFWSSFDVTIEVPTGRMAA